MAAGGGRDITQVGGVPESTGPTWPLATDHSLARP
jgi:hypothetical protein